MDVTINLSLPFKVRDDQWAEWRADPKSGFKTTRDVSDWLIRSAVAARYRDVLQGVDGRMVVREGMANRTEQRIWGAIQDLLADKSDAIVISGEALRWLHESVDKWQVPPALASWSLTLLDALKREIDSLDSPKPAAAQAAS